MSKEKISSSYMEEMKKIHADKPYRDFPNVIITGAANKDSIGESIVNTLLESEKIGSLKKVFSDVRSSDFVFSGIDTLIMCHGALHMDWLEDAPEEKIKEVLDVNLYGSIRLVKQFVNQTINENWRKQIISIGSMAYRNVLNGSSAYCASKAGLAHFMKCAAWELAPKGYDVFSIHPSNTEGTPMAEETIKGLMRYRDLTRQEAEGYWSAVLPKENWLQTKDISDLVKFLLLENSEYLSGTNIDLGGGQR